MADLALSREVNNNQEVVRVADVVAAAHFIENHDGSNADELPPDIVALANLIRVDTLPEKSKRTYTQKYNLYKTWCTNHHITNHVSEDAFKDTLSGSTVAAAIYHKLPFAEEYTSHSMRRSSATLYADSGADLEDLVRHGKWKNPKCAQGYVADSKYTKNKTAHQLSNFIMFDEHRSQVFPASSSSSMAMFQPPSEQASTSTHNLVPPPSLASDFGDVSLPPSSKRALPQGFFTANRKSCKASSTIVSSDISGCCDESSVAVSTAQISSVPTFGVSTLPGTSLVAQSSKPVIKSVQRVSQPFKINHSCPSHSSPTEPLQSCHTSSPTVPLVLDSDIADLLEDTSDTDILDNNLQAPMNCQNMSHSQVELNQESHQQPGEEFVVNQYWSDPVFHPTPPDKLSCIPGHADDGDHPDSTSQIDDDLSYVASPDRQDPAYNPPGTIWKSISEIFENPQRTRHSQNAPSQRASSVVSNASEHNEDLQGREFKIGPAVVKLVKRSHFSIHFHMGGDSQK
ncbi:hypothetical protein QAD02_008487 [Eretmocerus hayati]|uniref:Uncharacterized protein n=1 Tax=Eretmocerus hayati TaxID=131215 RepID=A0ACC2NB14_9HYME|nr:hypothetical protein QAD02_008487 [Eretmocerus hayati]